MGYLILYFVALAAVNFVVMKFARSGGHMLLLALLTSVALCAVYQAANYFIYGPDPFIKIAVAVQVAGGFIFSLVFGMVYLNRKAEKK